MNSLGLLSKCLTIGLPQGNRVNAIYLHVKPGNSSQSPFRTQSTGGPRCSCRARCWTHARTDANADGMKASKQLLDLTRLCGRPQQHWQQQRGGVLFIGQFNSPTPSGNKLFERGCGESDPICTTSSKSFLEDGIYLRVA